MKRSLAGIMAALTALILPTLGWAAGESINIKLNSGTFTEGTLYGCYPVDGSAWQVVGGGTTVTDEVLTGGEKVSYVTSATWSMGSSGYTANVLLDAYLDDGVVSGAGTTITVSGLNTTTYANYDVLIYMTADTTPSVEKHFFAPTVNGTQYTVGGAGSANWGNVNSFGLPILGVNCLHVAGLTATAENNTLTISVPGIASADRGNGRASISAIQIIPGVGSAPESMSFYLDVDREDCGGIDNTYTAGTKYGWDNTQADGSTWNEFTNTVQAPKDNRGIPLNTATLVVNGKGGDWGYAAPESLGGVKRGYRDGPWNLSLKGIPYSQYKVVLFMATDNANKVWGPVKVTSGGTETYYTYDDDKKLTTGDVSSTWGQSQQSSGVEGVDVMVIPGLSGDIDLLTHGTSGTDSVRGGLFAMQIINTGTHLFPNNCVATVSGTKNWTDLTWSPAAPTFVDFATLKGEGSQATLNLNTDVRVQVLGTAGSAIALTGENKLTSNACFVNTNTDMSAMKGALSLGVATLSKGAGNILSIQSPDYFSTILQSSDSQIRYAGDRVLDGFNLDRASQSKVILDKTISSVASTQRGNGSLSVNNNRIVTIDENADITVAARFVMADDGNASPVVNLNGGKLTVKGSGVANNTTNGSAVLLAHWPGTPKFNLNKGEFSVEKGAVMLGWSGDPTLTVGASLDDAHVAGSAVLSTKGIIGHGASDQGPAGSLVIKPSGLVKLGSVGIDFSNARKTGTTVKLAGGELQAIDTATLKMHNQSGFSVEADSTITVDSDKTLTVTAQVNAEDGVTITKKGLGTLDLSQATLSEELQYDVQAGAIIFSAGAEPVGNVTLTADATLKVALTLDLMKEGYTSVATVPVVFIDGETGATLPGSENTFNPLPIWTPDGTSQAWDNLELWNTEVVPTSGAVMIDASSVTSDLNVAIPTGTAFSTIKLAGSATYTINLTITDPVISSLALTVDGRAYLPSSIVDNKNVTIVRGDASTYITTDATFSSEKEGKPTKATLSDATLDADGAVAYATRDNCVWDSNVSVKLDSESQKNAFVFGGAGELEAGTIKKDIWLNVVGGRYDLIFGGSNSNSWNTSGDHNIAGDIFVEMTGGTANGIFGGSYKDGYGPDLTGNIDVVVGGDAQVSGIIAGGGISAHNQTTTYGTAEAEACVTLNVLVKNVQSTENGTDPLVSNLGGLLPGYIIGGGLWGSNAGGSHTINGTSAVTIDLAADATGTFTKSIIGGSSNRSDNTETVMNTTKSTAVAITAPNAVTFSGDIYGAHYTTGNGSGTVPTSSVTINGGKYTGAIYAGGSGANSTVSTSANVTLKDGIFTGTIAPGANSATVTASALTVNGDIDLSGATVGNFGTLTVDAEKTLTLAAGVTVGAVNLNGNLKIKVAADAEAGAVLLTCDNPAAVYTKITVEGIEDATAEVSEDGKAVVLVLPPITIPKDDITVGNVTLGDAARATLLAAAVAKGESITEVKAGDADKAAYVNDALQVFDAGIVTVDDGGEATVDWHFGITDIKRDGEKITITAQVLDTDKDDTTTAKFASDVTVALVDGEDSIGTPVKPSDTGMVSFEIMLTDLVTDGNARTFEVKASK